MTKKLISTNSFFETDVAFSRAVVVNNTVYVSGCTGYNYATTTISDSIVAQTEQTFTNIIFALQQAGATLADVVRVTYIVPNATEFELCKPVIRKYFNTILPACTVMCANLISPALKIEIEVTAVITT